MAFKEYCGVELNIVSLIFLFVLSFSYKYEMPIQQLSKEKLVKIMPACCGQIIPC